MFLSTPHSRRAHRCRSFHALDSEGNIRVWGRPIETLRLDDSDRQLKGTLNAETRILRDEGYSGQTIPRPVKLSLPIPFRSIR